MKSHPLWNTCFAAILWAQSATGALVYGNFSPGDTFGNYDPLDYQCVLAVPFTPTGMFALDSLSVGMSFVSGENKIRLTVRPDADGVPGSSVLETIDLGGFYFGTGTVETGQSSLHPVLDAGVTYWVVAQTVNTGDVLSWHLATTPSYGRAYISTMGYPWTVDYESTYSLRVEGIQVPEPKSWTLLCLAALVLGGRRWICRVGRAGLAWNQANMESKNAV